MCVVARLPHGDELPQKVLFDEMPHADAEAWCRFCHDMSINVGEYDRSRKHPIDSFEEKQLSTSRRRWKCKSRICRHVNFGFSRYPGRLGTPSQRIPHRLTKKGSTGDGVSPTVPRSTAAAVGLKEPLRPVPSPAVGAAEGDNDGSVPPPPSPTPPWLGTPVSETVGLGEPTTSGEGLLEGEAEGADERPSP